MKCWPRLPELQIEKLKFTEIFNALFKFAPGEMVTHRAPLRTRPAKKGSIIAKWLKTTQKM
jgi:hypothetical protein